MIIKQKQMFAHFNFQLRKFAKPDRALLHAQELPGSQTATLICEAFEATML